MKEPVDTVPSIWLEVSNIAIDIGKESSIHLQLKGDLETERWFRFKGDAGVFKALTESMKDKRPMYAKLELNGPQKEGIGVSEVRVAFSAPAART